MKILRKMRLLEHWNESDAALLGEFTRARFALMLDRKPLVTRSEANAMKLQVLPYDGQFRNLFGILRIFDE